eukprot:jgi/Botrbrau1/16448/Bobra.0142s0044.1
MLILSLDHVDSHLESAFRAAKIRVMAMHIHVMHHVQLMNHMDLKLGTGKIDQIPKSIDKIELFSSMNSLQFATEGT